MYAFLQLPAILARGHTPTQDFPTLGTSITPKHIRPTPTGLNLLSQRNQKLSSVLRIQQQQHQQFRKTQLLQFPQTN
jgi:hypothetical protein